VLLGESFSGPIAISIAASRPPHLVGLILCVTFARNPLPLLGSPWLLPLLPFGLAPKRVINAFLLGGFATAPLIESVRATFNEVPPETFKARLGAVARCDARRALANLRVPLLYLRATRDRLVPRRCAEAMAQIATHMRIVDIEAPHTLLQVKPAAAAAAVKSFIDTLPATAARR
jgi:pimeloyl-ACP methyl ester carboxylesterase